MSIVGSYVRLAPYLFRVAKGLLGKFPRTCNLCGFHGKFLAFGLPPRFDAYCPKCGSLERHRLFGLWLTANKSQIVGRNVLHFAPEAVLRRKIAPLAGTYRAADIDPRFADIVLDIEKIDLTEQSVDVIVCSHILEHVDHTRALAELRRVLTRDGLLLLLFPIVEGWDETYRNGAVTSPHDRDLHFGQCDHIQYFGRGVRRDIVAAGFDLTEFTAVEPDVSAHALARGEKLFIARPSRSA